ncbi:NAD(P)H-hydrate dehydratase [Candidatus Dojkabacteria bacterium]|nr:NAD(P)H-hydrate dehydratase [Candidatus Dojkabacteria bacterium]
MIQDPFKRTKILDTNARYLGIPIEELIEKAGKGIAKELCKKYGKTKSYNFVCGLGNNGGDGFAAARNLAELDVEKIRVYLIGRVNKIKSKAALKHWKKLSNSKYVENEVIKLKSDAYSKDIVQADISVECLVGTGIKGKLHKRFHDVIVRLTKQKTDIVAVDVPVPGYNPKFAISLMYPKVDKAKVVNIKIPKEAETYTGPGDIKILEVPKENSYKSQNGELLIYGGSHQFHGAPLMAMKAASKLVGSVFFYTNPENREVANKVKTELDEFILINDNDLEKYANYADAFLFGPGLEGNLPTKAIISSLLRKYPDKPTILDAYAISVASEKQLLKNKILTPHRGELRHMFGDNKYLRKYNTPKILEGRVKRFAVENECFIILKGHTDVLFHKEGTIALNKTGNQGMAKGGTGDVLAGILGGLITKNDIWISMRAASFINGKAGDNLRKQIGYNFSATDLIPKVQEVIEWGKNY